MRFAKWLETFLEEKGIGLEEYLDTFRGDEFRALSVGFVVEHIKAAHPREREKIKDVFVRIDFSNGDARDFLAHLGAALWEEADRYLAVV